MRRSSLEARKALALDNYGNLIQNRKAWGARVGGWRARALWVVSTMLRKLHKSSDWIPLGWVEIITLSTCSRPLACAIDLSSKHSYFRGEAMMQGAGTKESGTEHVEYRCHHGCV